MKGMHIMPSRRHAQDAQRGQVLVIVALGLVVLVAMVGVVIDGGYAWGKQRETQNGADASAEAGAVQLAENVAGTVPARTDTDVLDAVNAAGAANNIGNPLAYYTDISGNLLDPTGAVVTDVADAAAVGGGSIPRGASGVRTNATQTFDTFLARVIGISQLTTTTTATAVAGYLASTCDADAGCIVLPITVPVTVLGCDGQNKPSPVDPPVPWDAPGPVISIPLCQNGPGNVGWIDWTPTAGGASELKDAILTPSNISLTWPGWYFVTQTGNPNSKPIQDALRTHDGEPVRFPEFDATCDAQPTGTSVSGCPNGHLGGNGSQQWYHLAGMSTFLFCIGGDAQCDAAGFAHGAYVNGNNKAVCDTGNGSTSCLAGRFTAYSDKGSVEAAPGTGQSKAEVGVQLIR
jgi:Flp pilus assembly protein TadG